MKRISTAQLIAAGSIVILLAVCSVALFVRFVSDDYCLATDVRQSGLLGAEIHLVTQINGRFTSGLAFYSLEAIGLWTVQWAPIALLLVWFWLTAWTATELLKSLGLKCSKSVSMVIAGVILGGTVFGSPYPFQSFYWQTAMAVYFTPIVIATGALGLALRTGLQGWRPVTVCGVAAFLATGCNEVFGTSLFCALSLMLLATLGKSRLPALVTRRRQLVAIWVAAGVGNLAVVLSPGSLQRAGLSPHGPVLEVISAAATDAAGLVGRLISLQPTVWIGVTVVSFWLGTELTNMPDSRLKPGERRGLWTLMLATTTATFLLSFAPSLYDQRNVPPDRALVLATLVLMFDVCALAAAAGRAFRQRASSPLTTSLLPSIAILTFVGCFGGQVWTRVLTQYPSMHAYDVRKDQQWSVIETTARNHVQDVVAPALGDASHMGLLSTSSEEIGPDPTYYVNGCAAGYFEVRTIKTG